MYFNYHNKRTKIRFKNAINYKCRHFMIQQCFTAVFIIHYILQNLRLFVRSSPSSTIEQNIGPSSSQGLCIKILRMVIMEVWRVIK